ATRRTASHLRKMAHASRAGVDVLLDQCTDLVRADGSAVADPFGEFEDPFDARLAVRFGADRDDRMRGEDAFPFGAYLGPECTCPLPVLAARIEIVVVDVRVVVDAAFARECPHAAIGGERELGVVLFVDPASRG